MTRHSELEFELAVAMLMCRVAPSSKASKKLLDITREMAACCPKVRLVYPCGHSVENAVTIAGYLVCRVCDSPISSPVSPKPEATPALEVKRIRFGKKTVKDLTK